MDSEPSLSDTEQLEIPDDFMQDSHNIGVEDEQYEDHISWGGIDDPRVGMDLLERWKDIMQKLLNDEIRWDDEDIDSDGDGRKKERNPKPAVLDPQTKKSLSEVDQKYRPDPTVLHRLALRFDHEGFSDLVKRRPRTADKIVNYLLQQRNGNPQHTADEDSILKRAIESKNLDFIKFVSSRCTKYLPDLLDSKDTQGANCMHYLFRHHLPLAAKEWLRAQRVRSAGKEIKEMPLNLLETVSSLRTFALHAKPSTIIARDQFGNTPIHYAMDYSICRIRLGTSYNVYPAIVIALVKKGDKAQVGVEQVLNEDKESPYLYFIRTQQEYLANRRKEIEKRNSSLLSTAGPKAVSGNSKAAKPEILDSRVAAAEQVERNLDTYSKGPSVKDIHRRIDPREVVVKMKSDMTGSAGPPSVDGREDFKGHNITSAKEPDNMDAPPGYGLRSTRTGESYKAPTNQKAPPYPYITIGNPKAEGFAVTPLNEKLLSISGAGGFTTRSRSGTQTNAEKQVARRLTPWEEPTAQREAAENMRRRLKLHYIRTQPDRKAKVLLYGRVASGMCLKTVLNIVQRLRLFYFVTHIREYS